MSVAYPNAIALPDVQGLVVFHGNLASPFVVSWSNHEWTALRQAQDQWVCRQLKDAARSRTALANPVLCWQTTRMRIGEFEFDEPLPELKDPHVLAVLRPWIDVGNVGSITLRRIERYLGAKEVGRLVRPGRFYDFTRYRPKTAIRRGKREYTIPTTNVKVAVRENGPDLITLHLLEPHAYSEDFTESVIEMLGQLGVKRYSMIGAMYDMVPHTRPLLVSGGSVDDSNEAEYRMVEVRPSDYEGPTTITHLIFQHAESVSMDTRIFVVHLPQYFQVEEDFTGAARLTSILCRLYGLPSRLEDRERGIQQYSSLQNIVDDASEVSKLLSRLEERYDRENEQTSSPPGPAMQLSPQIEEFLQGLDFGADLEPERDPDDDPGDE